MSQITTKWIADDAITAAKLDDASSNFVMKGIDATTATFVNATVLDTLNADNVVLQDATVTGNFLMTDASISDRLTASQILVAGTSGDFAIRASSPDNVALDATGSGTEPAVRATNLTSGGTAFTGHAVDGWALFSDNSSTISATIYATNTAAGDAGCIYANTSADGAVDVLA